MARRLAGTEKSAMGSLRNPESGCGIEVISMFNRDGRHGVDGSQVYSGKSLLLIRFDARESDSRVVRKATNPPAEGRSLHPRDFVGNRFKGVEIESRHPGRGHVGRRGNQVRKETK